PSAQVHKPWPLCPPLLRHDQRVGIMRQAIIPCLRFFRMENMPFKLVAEMPDGTCHRPCRGVSQWAYRVSIDFPLYIPQQVDVGKVAMTILYLMQHFFHPSCAFAARRTLSATFMMIKACKVQCVAYDTLILVKSNKAARSHGSSGHKSAVSQRLVRHEPRIALGRLQRQVCRQDRD